MEQKICVDCSRDFELTDSEVEFYEKMMADNPNFQKPKRCKNCRRLKKEQKLRKPYGREY